MMYKRLSSQILLIGLFILAATFSGCLNIEMNFAQGGIMKRAFAFEPPNIDSVKNVKFNITPYLEKYKGNNAVFLNFIEILDQVSYDRSVFTKRVKYIILNKEYTSLTTIQLSDEVASFYAVVRNPDGWEKTFGKSDLIETSENGSTVYKLAFPNVQNGTLIEYGFEMQVINALYSYPFVSLPTQLYHPCENLKVIAAVPSFLQPYVKPLPNSLGGVLKTEIDEDNEKTIFYYNRKNISAIREEKLSLYINQIVPPFVVSHRMGILKRQISYIESIKPSWEATPYKADIAEDFVESVKNLVRKCKTKQEKVDTLVRYVRREIKVSPNFYVSSVDYEDVLEEKTAPARVIVGLLQAMLWTIDVKAKYIMAYPVDYGDTEGLNEEVRYMEQGLMFNIDNKEYVVFPLYDMTPYHTIPYNFMGQKALLLEPRSEENHDDFVFSTIVLPTSNPIEPEIVETLDVTIAENGTISIKDKRELYGDAAFSTHRDVNAMKKEDWEGYFKNHVMYEDVKLNITKLNYEKPKKNSSDPITINSEYSIDNMVSILPDEAIIQTNGLLGLYSYFAVRDDSSKRENQVKIYYNEKSTRKIIFHLPANWQISNAKPLGVTKNSIGEVLWKFTQNDSRTITIEIVRTIKAGTYKPEFYTELLEIIGTHGKYMKDNLVFSIIP